MVSERSPAVYILASQKAGTLYVGVTSDLVRRVWAHRNGAIPGFTHRYNVKSLAYFEQHGDMYQAICREKALKKWSRSWKLALITRTNPEWRDLWFDIVP